MPKSISEWPDTQVTPEPALEKRTRRVQAIFRDGSESFGLSVGNKRNSGYNDPYHAIIPRYSH